MKYIFSFLPSNIGRNGLLILLSSLFAQLSFGQCSIQNGTFQINTCDESVVSVTINFDVDEPGNSGFQITGNGINYGTFMYNERPVLLEGIEANCNTAYSFTIRDVEDPSCSTFMEVGEICCSDDCFIEITNILHSNCEDQVADLTVELSFVEIGFDSFDLFYNDEFVSSAAYSDLPAQFLDFDFGSESSSTWVVCDQINTQCCDTLITNNPCSCGIFNVSTSIVDCSEGNQSFFGSIDFEHQNTSDSFLVGSTESGFLGTFSYDVLPLVLGPFEFSTENLELLILDQSDPICFNSADFGTVNNCNFDCELFNLFAESSPCEDDDYEITLFFESNQVSDSFLINVEGLTFGPLAYGEDSYSVGPIPGNCVNAPVVLVTDALDSLCFDFYNFSEPICCDDCGMVLDISDVSCDDGTTYITSLVNSFSEEEYFLLIEGVTYGPFSVDDEELLNLNLGTGVYEVVAFGALDSTCTAEAEFFTDCNDELCNLSEFIVEVESCLDSSFTARLSFNAQGDLSDSFNVLVNGDFLTAIGYSDLPYEVENLFADCITNYTFEIQDQQKPMCSDFYAFEDVVCCPDTLCTIDQLSAQLICNEGVPEFFILDFESDNSSEFYNLFIEGLLIGSFEYASLPDTFEVERDSFGIAIVDTENPDCSISDILRLDCPSQCNLNGYGIALIDCVFDTANISIELVDGGFVDDGLVVVDSDTIRVDNDDFPIPFSLKDDTDYSIFFYDLTEPNCSLLDSFYIPPCLDYVEEESVLESVYTYGSQIFINADYDGGNLLLYNLQGIFIEELIVHDHGSQQFMVDVPIGCYLIKSKNGFGSKIIFVGR